jgi:hypothetical protein
VQTVLHPSSEPEEPLGRDLRLLRYAAIAFVVAVAIHGGDHAYRGLADQSRHVLSAGTIQALLGGLVVVLVFLRHRAAPIAAVGIGFASAILFSAAHLLPAWGAFSDSYVSPGAAAAGVSWFSWTTAVLEIGADLLFGWAGLNVVLHARTESKIA